MTTDNFIPVETLNALREAVVGKRVLAAKDETLRLDDGTVLELYESDSDCCAGANGRWVIKPDMLEAVITDVKVSDVRGCESYGETTNSLTITILHNQNPLALAECEADDGNGGYYYSVLSVRISSPFLPGGDYEVLSA